MKRLSITLEYPPQRGGIASYVYNYLLHVEAGEQVVYAPTVQGSVEFDAQQPWKTYRLNPYVRWFWPHWIALFFQVRQIVKTEKITELYVHHALPVGYVAYLILKLFKVPYTLFLHGTDLEFGSRKPLKRVFLRFVARNARLLVVNSNFLKNKLIERIGAVAPMVVVYPSPSEQFFAPIDTATLDQHRSELALNGKKVILTVGRLVEGKGHLHLLRNFLSVAKEVPNAVLLIVGTGPKQQELWNFVEKNYLQNAVRFLGELPHDELPLYFQLADVFALLTHPDQDAEEGWGTVFLEAAASGLPVVAGRAGGSPEAVVDLETGLVVDVHQDKAVVKSIVDLLKNTTYAKEMGARGKERAQRDFNWKKQIAVLESRNI